MITREELAARIYESSVHNEKKVKDAQNLAEKAGNPHKHRRPVGIELAHMAFNAAEDFMTVLKIRSINKVPEGAMRYDFGIDPAGEGEDRTVEITILDEAEKLRARRGQTGARERGLINAGWVAATKPMTLEDVKAAFPGEEVTQHQDEFIIGEDGPATPADLNGAPDWVTEDMLPRGQRDEPAFHPTSRTLDQNAAKKWLDANPKAVKGAAQTPAFKSDPKGPFWIISSGDGRKYQRWTKAEFAQHFGQHVAAGTLETEAAMLHLCPKAARAFAAFISQ